jgi:hypothetical protein
MNDRDTVRTLLGAAGLEADADELAKLTEIYPAVRSMVESLYALEATRYEAPALVFDAAPTFADWA